MVGLSIAESASIMNTSLKGSMASLTVLFFMSSAPCNIYYTETSKKGTCALHCKIIFKLLKSGKYTDIINLTQFSGKEFYTNIN